MKINYKQIKKDFINRKNGHEMFKKYFKNNYDFNEYLDDIFLFLKVKKINIKDYDLIEYIVDDLYNNYII